MYSKGGGSNPQCLPLHPDFYSTVSGAQTPAFIYGAEYQDTNGLVANSHDTDKAVGSGKAGKAKALPDFPPSVHFYINACVPRRTDRCIKRHMHY